MSETALNVGRLVAPWTPEQVGGLNRWQEAAWVHPFTCGGERDDDAHRRYSLENGGDWGQLAATPDGWACPVCDYRQDWAHDFMAKGPPPDPFSLCASNFGGGE